MANRLKRQFEECKEVLFEATIDALRERADYIVSIERTARGEIPVTGLSLDLAPWHAGVGLSLRSMEDFPCGSYRYGSADWKYFHFTEGCCSAKVREAEAFIQEMYRSRPDELIPAIDRAHLIFLAGAEALVSPKIAVYLSELGVKAPVVTNHFVSHAFEFIVTDPDGTIAGNYCEIVLANRVSSRLFSGDM